MTIYLPYTDLKNKQTTNIRPVEHFVSFLLPTLRWGIPSYICFCGPQLKLPHTPPKIAPPDRWWAYDAISGHMIIYALERIISFAPDKTWETVTLNLPVTSIKELIQIDNQIEALLTQLASAFFDRQLGDAVLRKELMSLLSVRIGPALVPRYFALAPDFWVWLQS